MIRKIFEKENRLFLYLSLVILLILFLSTFASKWSSVQSIESFVISGNTYIPSKELLGNIDSASIKSIRDDVDLLELKDKIIKHPFILTTYVMQRNSSVIEIEVKERTPVAILVKNDGNFCYCDDMLALIPYRISLKFNELPVLRNFFNNKGLDSVALLGAIDILRNSKKKELENLYNLISEIEFDKESKSYTIVTADNAYSVKLGKAENIKEKLSLFSGFLGNAIQEVNTNEIKYIDIRWEDRIIIQTKQEIFFSQQIKGDSSHLGINVETKNN